VWRERWAKDHLKPKERGRRTDGVSRDQLWSLLAVFGLIGPQVGLPTLQSLLPEIPRAALVSLQARCRAIYRRKSSWVIHALRWTCPGSVWAIDFAEPPEPLEGIYTHLLVVRDLPSGYVLIAIPTIAESATLVVHVLASIFKWFGVPLVLKSDNGGPFITDEVKALLREHNVLPLYSPPGDASLQRIRRGWHRLDQGPGLLAGGARRSTRAMDLRRHRGRSPRGEHDRTTPPPDGVVAARGVAVPRRDHRGATCGLPRNVRRLRDRGVHSVRMAADGTTSTSRTSLDRSRGDQPRPRRTRFPFDPKAANYSTNFGAQIEKDFMKDTLS
jgi:hypothetical protein